MICRVPFSRQHFRGLRAPIRFSSSTATLTPFELLLIISYPLREQTRLLRAHQQVVCASERLRVRTGSEYCPTGGLSFLKGRCFYPLLTLL